MHTDEKLSALNQFILFRIHGRRFILLAFFSLVAVAILGWLYPPLLWLYLLFLPIVVVGLWDLYFSTNTILRNFPFLGHFRYFALSISPEIHQYFIEDNTAGKPFSKIQRDMVNKRAERRMETHPFGTEEDVQREGYEWVSHSIYPKPCGDTPPPCTGG